MPIPRRTLAALLGGAALATLAAPPALDAQTRRPPTRPAGGPSGVPVAKSVAPPVEQIAATERAFAAATRERGIRDAFLAYMADEGLLFRPTPITARVWLVTHPPTPGTLAWEPVWGAASAAGDIGFTTGPYTHRGAGADSAPGHGQYLTVWARQENGSYRALLDVGVPGPETPAEPFVARPLAAVAARPTGGATAAGIAEATRATLFIADRGLAAAAGAGGLGPSLAAVAAPDIRVLRPGRAPTFGRDSVTVVLPTPAGSWSWRTQDARVARSGDLGMTYGAYEGRDGAGAVTEAGSYVRVWTREPAGWRVLVDLALPSTAAR
jgi:ketosteroid isomerase-like protein